MKIFYLALLGGLALSGLTGCSSSSTKSGCSQYASLEECGQNSCFWNGDSCQSNNKISCSVVTNSGICAATKDSDANFCS